MYPFAPRSTSKLLPGQFWSVPLESGGFACGRVLQVEFEGNPSRSRAFFGCLMDWFGSDPPSADAIAGSKAARFGVMHVRAITETGGEVLGERPLDLDGIELPVHLSAKGGPDTQILVGAAPVRTGRRDEWGKYPVLGFWGTDFILQLAEKLRVEKAID